MTAHPETRTNRRAGHVLVDRPLPVATRAELHNWERVVALHGEDQVNQSISSLIRARKAIGDARLACLWAKRQNPAHQPVLERLSAISSALHDMLKEFPLDVHP